MNPNESPNMTFEEEEFEKRTQASVPSSQVSGVLKVAMKFTGGSQKRAEYFIFVFVIFSTLFSLLAIFNSTQVEIDPKYVFNSSNPRPDYTNQ